MLQNFKNTSVTIFLIQATMLIKEDRNNSVELTKNEVNITGLRKLIILMVVSKSLN